MYTFRFQSGREIWFDPLRVKLYDHTGENIKVSMAVQTDPDCSKVTNQMSTHLHANTRSTHPTNLRIVLGYACNYRCKYCSQQHESYKEINNEPTVDKFIDSLTKTITFDRLNLVQFWGGEPLLYWSNIQYLMKRLREIKPTLGYSMVTNGSLITQQIADQINDDPAFGFILSHDGPGQHFRGIDPLREGSHTRDILIEMAVLKRPKRSRTYVNEGRNFAVNPVISAAVGSLVDLVEWYDSVFGFAVPIAEAIPVTPISPGSESCALHYGEYQRYTKMLVDDLLRIGIHRFDNYHLSMELFAQKLNLEQFTVNPVKAHCFTTDPNMLTLDIHGRILPCQTFGPGALMCDGSPAMCGTLDDLKRGTLTMPPVYGYGKRGSACEQCPVVSFCMGGCPYLVGNAHVIDCRTKYHHFCGLLMTYLSLFFGERVVHFEKRPDTQI